MHDDTCYRILLPRKKKKKVAARKSDALNFLIIAGFCPNIDTVQISGGGGGAPAPSPQSLVLYAYAGK